MICLCGHDVCEKNDDNYNIGHDRLICPNCFTSMPVPDESIDVDIEFPEGIVQILTRDQAIKRIRDIRLQKSIDHLNKASNDNYASYLCSDDRADIVARMAAQFELIAIFDIKEEEL